MSRKGADFVLIADVPNNTCLVIGEGDNMWDALNEVNAMSGTEWGGKDNVLEGFTILIRVVSEGRLKQAV